MSECNTGASKLEAEPGNAFNDMEDVEGGTPLPMSEDLPQQEEQRKDSPAQPELDSNDGKESNVEPHTETTMLVKPACLNNEVPSNGHSSSLPEMEGNVEKETQVVEPRIGPSSAEADIEKKMDIESNGFDQERFVNSSERSDDVNSMDQKESHTSTDPDVASGDTELAELAKEEHPEQPIDAEQKLSSLELRRLPIDVLLKPDFDTKSSLEESLDDEDSFEGDEGPKSFIRRTCLNPNLFLRTQLMLSFGMVSTVTIAFVLLSSIIISWNSGEKVKSITKSSFEDLVITIEGTTARYLAESLTPKLIKEEVVLFLYESVRDRFAGYPNDGDDFVPFYDLDSQTNKYPIIGATGKALPLDWQIESNVNASNFEEHVQDRWSWYQHHSVLGTANAFYTMQGMCDPSITDPYAETFWPNCTEAHNDVTTGGVSAPSPTNLQIYRKGASLAPILKALYESDQDIRDLGAYFSNSGAGAVVSYPQFPLRTSITYESIGCEWMNEPNPYDPSRPIGTREEIDRCHPAGTIVSAREYNPLERPWCKNQALNPQTILAEGPLRDAWHDLSWVLAVGRAVYDRFSNDFISCTYVGYSLETIESILSDSRIIDESEISVVKSDDHGTVVASTAWHSSTKTEAVLIDQLQIGATAGFYQQLTSLVDYDEIWDPSEVRRQYEAFTTHSSGYFLTTYPMPPVPTAYTPSYKPEFFVIVSESEEHVFAVVEKVNKDVDEHLSYLIILSVAVGLGGLGLVILLLFFMSQALTAPLNYMNYAADEIVNHFGSSKVPTDKIGPASNGRGYVCAPRTELNEVVHEFNKMVASFSGSFASIAKSVAGKHGEVPNQFEMHERFNALYASRKEAEFAYALDDSDNGELNLGSNIKLNRRASSRRNSMMAGSQIEGRLRSRLFLWTSLLIGIPLLLTTIAISAAVMYTISSEFDQIIEGAEVSYVAVELDALLVHARLRADLAAGRTARPVRDLYLLTRYASWLLLGGVQRADSFTEIPTGSEKCKTYGEDFEECPWLQDSFFCDCAWNDNRRTCQNYTFDTRDRQEVFYSCESHDTFPNGDRNSSTFPNVCDSPENTAWWDDVNEMPGAEKGSSASGHETTYDRLRVSSASPVHQVVYNQDVEKLYLLGTYLAFEADGMFIGFSGCSGPRFSATNPLWSSADWNGAYKLRPEICPKGKYGYDPRCRGWYDNGKKLAEANATPIYITPPYSFSSGGFIGSSVTSPLIDTGTNEYLGQVLIDFLSGPVFDSLDASNTPLFDGGFPILITTLFDEDSVVAPGFSAYNESARPITELVLRYDQNCTTDECDQHRFGFEQIVSSMKNGESGRTNFTRTSATGDEETIYMSYAPVVLKGYRPLDSSDFSRGVEPREYEVYSLALAETESGLLEPFQEIRDGTSKQIKITIFTLSVVIFLSILFVLYVSNVVTMSVTAPMVFLRDVIRSINRLKVDEEPPIVDRSVGSRELICVSETIQTLYKVVRCGNYAFFSGDLEKAYAVLRDALRLFVNLDNKKAIGVVSNNLGNLSLVMYRTLVEAEEELVCGMAKKEIISKGTAYFHDAIQLGEKAYDEFHEIEGWSPNCLDFMQHLSNRYFNRAMFLLAVKDGHDQPDELKRLGLRDLEIARDMDTEIVDQGEEAGWGYLNRVEKILDVSLVRARGHLLLLEIGYPDEWETEELLDDAFKMLKTEIKKNGGHKLETVSAIGRLQAIETELIKYKLLKGEVKVAAQIGIRMLFEDEYTLPEAQVQAVEALTAYIDLMDVDAATRAKMKRGLSINKNSLVDVFEDRTRISVTTHDSEDYSNLTAMRRSVAGSDFSACKSVRSSIHSVRECRRGYVTMEEI